VVPADQLRAVPDRLTDAQASMLGTTYGTAHYALLHEGKLNRGDVCVVHAAAGALGLAACQVAKAHGAIVVATAGSDAKLLVAKEKGSADAAVCYRDAGWVDAVKAALPEGKADIIFDPVGLPTASTKWMGYHSRLLVLGFTGWNAPDGAALPVVGPPGEVGGRNDLPTIALNRLLVKHCSVVGVYLYAFVDADPEAAAAMWADISAHLQSGAYDPVVYRTVPGGLDALPAALRLAASREVYGKVVLGMARGATATARL